MAQRKSEKPKKVKLSSKQAEFYDRVRVSVNPKKKGK
jgi:hypothetical protein